MINQQQTEKNIHRDFCVCKVKTENSHAANLVLPPYCLRTVFVESRLATWANTFSAVSIKSSLLCSSSKQRCCQHSAAPSALMPTKLGIGILAAC